MKTGILAGVLILGIGGGSALAATSDSMVLPLGSAAPEFKLQDVVTGKTVSLSDFSDKKGLLVTFICRHCPYVQHVKEGLAQLGRDYQGKEVGLVAISSNDPAAFPQDAPASLKEMAQQEGFLFPLLFDESQEVARAYGAACTPDFYLFDRGRKLVYHGQFDDSRPGSKAPVTGRDLRAALQAVLTDQPVSPDQKPSTGCSIKWKQ